jgi:hypothetical protein
MHDHRHYGDRWCRGSAMCRVLVIDQPRATDQLDKRTMGYRLLDAAASLTGSLVELWIFRT